MFQLITDMGCNWSKNVYNTEPKLDQLRWLAVSARIGFKFPFCKQNNEWESYTIFTEQHNSCSKHSLLVIRTIPDIYKAIHLQHRPSKIKRKEQY